jgi:REP element-mobilizing transposase RayT
MGNDKFQNKHRIPSNRAKWWNYSDGAAYFVTICTENKLHFLGEVSDEKMQLSEIGKIVESEWVKTIDLRTSMNLILGEYVIMPNHFHCIIIIGKNKYNAKIIQQPNKFGPQSQNLASIIRGFKMGVTIKARKIHNVFAWQTRYYDHIIRDADEYQLIVDYISNNPANWQNDKFHNN